MFPFKYHRATAIFRALNIHLPCNSIKPYPNMADGK
jgi:hypothetical protein